MQKQLLASVQDALKLVKSGQFKQAFKAIHNNFDPHHASDTPNTRAKPATRKTVTARPRKTSLSLSGLFKRLKTSLTPPKIATPPPTQRTPPKAKPKRKSPSKAKAPVAIPTTVTPPAPEVMAVVKTPIGQFINQSYSNNQGKRDYKLYIPSTYAAQPMPLIIMLHGCTQSNEDFAVGTGMNALAEQAGCLVAYPNQTISANFTRCWNWFKWHNQQRDLGEPAIIAGITHTIIKDYHIDTRRIYVAGISAGGALAATMATLYPELYTAVGVHSGLAYGSARDITSALRAMRGGKQTLTSLAKNPLVPTIIFHGDEDTTIVSRNGERIFTQAKTQLPSHITYQETITVEHPPEQHAYTRTRLTDPTGKTPLDYWLIHGAGHAWAGGSRDGSYTDPKGPNASQEILDFFLAHSH